MILKGNHALCQTLAYAIDGAYRVLHRSCHRGSGSKAAIEDYGWTRRQSNGRILCNLLIRRWSGHLCLFTKPPSSEKLPIKYMPLYAMLCLVRILMPNNVDVYFLMICSWKKLPTFPQTLWECDVETLHKCKLIR